MGNKGTKILAVVLSGILVMGCVASSVYAEENKKSDNPESNVTNASDSESVVDEILDKDVADAKSEGLYKDETVYVIAGAGGEVDKVIVSNWIKNNTGSMTISDATKLKDIVNVKGDETYTMNGDGMCVWDAKGHDIYYQGTADKAVPVDIKVSYKLDGASIAPEDLAGKSGKVTIRFDYTNNEYKMEKIDGKEEKIYVPFAMLTGTLMDNEIFSNIEVTNGKIVNQGETTIVTGLSFPGLQESLNLSGEDFEIPNYVEITADAKNFEMKNTVTVATSSLFDDFDTSKFDLDSLKDDMDKLKDGMQKLLDGSSELYDGIATLLDKSYDLVVGIRKLTEGAEKLRIGAQRLDDGTANLQDGAAQLAAGINQLKAGTESLSAGTSDLAEGYTVLQEGIYSASQSVGTMGMALKSLSAGGDSLHEDVEKILQDAGVDNPHKALVLSAIDDYTDNVDALASEVESGAGDVNALVDGAAEVSQGIAKLNAGAQEIDVNVGLLQTGAGGVYDGTRQIKSGTSELADGAEQLYKGLMEIDDNMPALIEGIEKLKDGAMELSDGLQKFNDEGISKITDLVDGDLGNASSRIKAVVDVAKSYKSFSGLGTGMDGETKLVYKTEEIKKPENNN
ncbi:MAG: hypothetical protein IK152_01420 [Lachnospiraceae bacterium]|nr:hypothetical protein [Lachnospiraceae bacterium]